MEALHKVGAHAAQSAGNGIVGMAAGQLVDEARLSDEGLGLARGRQGLALHLEHALIIGGESHAPASCSSR